MTLPADATKEHLDNGSDSVQQARVELADLVDKFNSLKNALGNLVELDVGAGLKSLSGDLVAERPHAALTANTTLDATHRAGLLVCTNGPTLTLTAAATLGAGWFATIVNADASAVLRVTGSQTIDGKDNLVLAPNQSATVFCDGSAFFSLGGRGFDVARHHELQAGAYKPVGTAAGDLVQVESDGKISAGLVDDIAAWGRFDGSGSTGAKTLVGGKNIASITKNGTGDYSVSFTNALASADYAVFGNPNFSGGTVSNYSGFQALNFATTGFDIELWNHGGSAQDATAVCFQVRI